MCNLQLSVPNNMTTSCSVHCKYSTFIINPRANYDVCPTYQILQIQFSFSVSVRSRNISSGNPPILMPDGLRMVSTTCWKDISRTSTAGAAMAFTPKLDDITGCKGLHQTVFPIKLRPGAILNRHPNPMTTAVSLVPLIARFLLLLPFYK